MISVRIQHMPAFVQCGVPFTITTCVTTDIAGRVDICASLPEGARCRVRTSAGPGAGEVCTATVVQSLVERCIDMTLTVECPGHSDEFVQQLTVTATNAIGESGSDFRPLTIRCS